MERLAEGAVGNGEHEADDEQDKDHDEAHPRKCDQRRENAARQVDTAPCEVAPV